MHPSPLFPPASSWQGDKSRIEEGRRCDMGEEVMELEVRELRRGAEDVENRMADQR